jgi:hypothetical protein
VVPLKFRQLNDQCVNSAVDAPCIFFGFLLCVCDQLNVRHFCHPHLPMPRHVRKWSFLPPHLPDLDLCLWFHFPSSFSTAMR